MQIIPAIDIKNGKCVRLVQGDPKQETVYYENPLDAMLMFKDRGAKRVHVVDLDAAIGTGVNNLNIIRAISKIQGIEIEIGGGIRDFGYAKYLLDQGISYVILGTVAIENSSIVSDLIEVFPKNVIVGVDARDGFVATRGWQQTSKISMFDFIKSMIKIKVKTFICTDISRDGMLEGVNLKQIIKISDILGRNASMIVSGGIKSIEDILEIKALNKQNIVGIITGKAIYSKSFDLKEGIKCLQKG